MDSKVDAGLQLLRKPELKLLSANTGLMGPECRSDDPMRLILDTPDNVPSAMTVECGGVGVGRKVFADFFRILIILLELYPLRLSESAVRSVTSLWKVSSSIGLIKSIAHVASTEERSR